MDLIDLMTFDVQGFADVAGHDDIIYFFAGSAIEMMMSWFDQFTTYFAAGYMQSGDQTVGFQRQDSIVDGGAGERRIISDEVGVDVVSRRMIVMGTEVHQYLQSLVGSLQSMFPQGIF